MYLNITRPIREADLINLLKEQKKEIGDLTMRAFWQPHGNNAHELNSILHSTADLNLTDKGVKEWVRGITQLINHYGWASEVKRALAQLVQKRTVDLTESPLMKVLEKNDWQLMDIGTILWLLWGTRLPQELVDKLRSDSKNWADFPESHQTRAVLELHPGGDIEWVIKELERDVKVGKNTYNSTLPLLLSNEQILSSGGERLRDILKRQWKPDNTYFRECVLSAAFRQSTETIGSYLALLLNVDLDPIRLRMIISDLPANVAEGIPRDIWVALMTSDDRKLRETCIKLMAQNSKNKRGPGH